MKYVITTDEPIPAEHANANLTFFGKQVAFEQLDTDVIAAWLGWADPAAFGEHSLALHAELSKQMASERTAGWYEWTFPGDLAQIVRWWSGQHWLENRLDGAIDAVAPPHAGIALRGPL